MISTMIETFNYLVTIKTSRKPKPIPDLGRVRFPAGAQASWLNLSRSTFTTSTLPANTTRP